MKKKPITLIKLGGSVITNKNTPLSVESEHLTALVKQIKRAMVEQAAKQLIVGHGSGSFGHISAKQYKTLEGFVNSESRLGMAIVQDAAAQLNRRVVAEFIKHGVPAVTFAPSNTLVVDDHQERENFFYLLKLYLEKGLFPVTYGDVVVDLKQGCTVWSTEEVFAQLIGWLIKSGYVIDSVVHVTQMAGFLDEKGKVIPEITAKTWSGLKKHLRKTKGVDVTGGMTLKVEESLKLAKEGIKSVVLAGTTDDNLYHYLVGQKWIGTQIS